MDEIVYLISMVDEVNDMGDPVKVPHKNDYIFAEKDSVRQSEFYQAAATGMKPELVFKVNSFEYNNETMLEYNDKTYKIIRTFEKKNEEKIELVCEGRVNNVTT